MAFVPLKTLGRQLILATWAGLVLTQTGCVTPGKVCGDAWHCWCNRHDQDQDQPCAVQQIVTTWDNTVLFDDYMMTYTGKPQPSLRGRLYLFGKDMGFPVQARGELIVDLFDLGQRDPDGKPKFLERCHYDGDALAKRLHKDIIGSGYSLLFPWDTYRPDITQISLRIFFVPEGGKAIQAPTVTLALQNERLMNFSSRQYPGPASASKSPPNAAVKLGSPR